MNVWVVMFYFRAMMTYDSKWAYGVFADETDAKDFRDKVEAMGASEAYAESALIVGEQNGSDVWVVYESKGLTGTHTVYTTNGSAWRASEESEYMGSEVIKAPFFRK